MFYRILYQLALPLGALLYLPKLLKKNRVRPPQKTKERLIWIHAVSMGETVAIAALVGKLKELYGERVQFVVSSQTKTGHAHAKKVLPFVEDHIYMPLDAVWIMKRFVEAAKPDLVLVSETDLWPNFLHLCKSQGAKLYLVNGKISPTSLRIYQKVPGLVNLTYGQFDRIFPQSKHYEERFRALGLPHLTTCGNLKLDFPKKEFQGRGFGLREIDLAVCIASTHDPEERGLLEVVRGMPHLRILLAPRHPHRVAEVEKLLQQLGLSYSRSSEGGIGRNRVLLVDQMGRLQECYASSDVAIVGGSFAQKVGGHNLIEPCEYGVPVLYGPHMWSQPELDALVKEYGAGEQVTLAELPEALKRYLGSKEKRRVVGERGKKLVEDNRGSSDRTLALLPQI